MLKKKEKKYIKKYSSITVIPDEISVCEEGSKLITKSQEKVYQFCKIINYTTRKIIWSM